MTAQEINEQLHRPIWSGFGYDRYFPESACSLTNLATGNTAVAIKEMSKWAKKYAHHCKEIAPVLFKGDLEDTVNEIQDFLYNHIQYSIDGENQNLKSPACAWATRAEGTDCKSYSIFASAILLNLDIKHYLRRIKQPSMADAFTHVYVVVPVDQKNGKLSSGYFIIDGTIELNNELPFIGKDDIYMEPNLKINGLAGAFALSCPGTDCGCSKNAPRPYDLMYNNYPGDFTLASPIMADYDVDVEIDKFNQVLDLLEQNGIPAEYTDQVMANLQHYIDLGIEPTLEQLFLPVENQSLGFFISAATVETGKQVVAFASKILPGDFLKKIFGSIDCIGGSAFGGPDVKQALQEQTSFVENKINAINHAAFEGSLNILANECMEFIAANDESHRGMVEKLAEGWNSCSTKNMQTFIKTLEMFKNIANKALEAWLNEFYIVSYSGSKSINTKALPIATYAANHLNYHNKPVSTRAFSLQVKPSTRTIYAFEFNETLSAQAEQGGRLDASSFLNSLHDVLQVIPEPNNNNQNNYSNNGSQVNDYSSQPKQAGGNMGMILLAAAAVGTVVYTQTKGKSKSKK